MNPKAVGLSLFIEAIALSPALGGTQSYVASDLLWKSDKTGGGTTINVCFVAQNSGIEIQEAKDALAHSWSYYSKVKFNFDPVQKADKSYYPCDSKFPGIYVIFQDSRPNSYVGVQYVDAPASEKSLWNSGKMPVGVKMILNNSYRAFPGGSYVFTPADVKEMFMHTVVHEFGHALGFQHEHFLPEVTGPNGISSDCLDHIKEHNPNETIGSIPKDLSTPGTKPYGTYSRLSIMHYACNEDAQKGYVGLPEVQQYLGPTDIATVRALYGVNNPSDYPYAVWKDLSNPSKKSLEGIDILETDDMHTVVFKLGGSVGAAYLNIKYFTVGKGAVKVVPPTPTMPPAPTIENEYGFLISNLKSSDGLPIFTAVDRNNPSLSAKFTVKVKSKVSNSFILEPGSPSFPGYEITLTPLDDNFRSVGPEQDGSKWEFSTFAGGPTPGFKWRDQSPPNDNYDRFSGYPSYYVWAEARNPLTFWICKGYGTYDAGSGNFYTDYDQRPDNAKWYYTSTGKFRTITNYSMMRFRIYAKDYSGHTIQSKDYVNLNFPNPNTNAFTTIVGTDPVEMVRLSGGKKASGEAITPFQIAIKEVSQFQYQMVTGQSPFFYPLGPNMPAERMTGYDRIIFCNKLSQMAGLPLVYSYSNPIFDADGHCTSMTELTGNLLATGYRLPTSDEWIFAFRAGTTTPYYWGTSASNSILYEWTIENDDHKPHPGGLLLSNGFGIYDMAGNVGEMVWEPGQANAVMRGGTYFDGASYGTKYSYTYSAPMGSQAWSYWGLRLVRTVPTIVPQIITPLLLSN
jgi:hypothetical protein